MQNAADAELTDEQHPEPFRGHRWKRRIFAGVGLLLAGLLLVAWWQRNTIADRFVQNELEAKDVRATYRIDQVGFRTQRISDLVIGDPANPDLTARLIEVDVALNFSGASLRDVRAYGVKVRGRFADGKLTFGELDKFADPESREPFKWPDIGLVVRDAQVRVETPWGVVGAALNGRGLLRNRFAADLSLRSPGLAGGGCSAPAVKFDGKLLLEWRQPRLVGPLGATRLDCKALGLAVASPTIDADLKMSERLDKWVGDVGFAARSADYPGLTLGNPAGKLSVDGGLKRTNFALALEKSNLRSAPLTVRQLALNANGYAGLVDGKFALSARGNVDVTGGALDRGMTGNWQGIVQQGRDTPVGPLLARMAPVLERAGDRFGGSLNFDAFRDFQGRSGATIGSFALDTASGARIRQTGALTVQNERDGWRLVSAAQLELSGRDLPNATLSLAPSQGDQLRGNLRVASYSVGGASIVIPGLAFDGRPGGAWKLDGRMTLSGPVPGGQVAGLSLPVTGRYDRGILALYDRCQTLAFDSLRLSGLRLAGQSLRLCPDAGRPMLVAGNGPTRFAAAVSNFAAKGTLGSSPLAARSANIRFSLDSGFVARDVTVELGQLDARTDLTVAVLTGRFGEAISGTLEGGSGQIGNVPLLIDEAAGNWRYLDDVLTFDSSLTVLDAAQVDRFQPMNVTDMLLTLDNNVITAIGHLVEPKTGTRVADVDIRHDLTRTAGRALLAVDGLRFNDSLQPDLLTPLTLGVVAIVDGAVFGDGRIEWDANGVRSSGRFATRNMNLAAAFGPVEGLSTEIVFTDLLGLQTGPAQIATIASVNPGIPALNGEIRYRLLPDQQVAIEAGRWPFAGGELVLEPTVLDFGVEKDRRLTFRVIGVDAEKFLAGYDFQNLRVSGIFDGTLPMIFNQDGGRIIGGALVSRPGGGEVSYLGELAYEDMGVFANFAFDALRSIRYNTLTIGVNGDLDGEIITDVSFTGLQQGSLAKRNYITKQLARIPIQFNVKITAEFLKLIGSIRGLYDADYAAQRDLPFLLERQQGVLPIDEAKPEKDKTKNE
ncbi:MAG: YdbH domain-containing protein [Sphingomonadaceae bacterium]|nr:YdbH domain-containing protein [Sphingomonadaceae bacterium]